MCRKVLTVATAAALAVLLLSAGAAAEPLRFHSPAVCETEAGSTITIPPGRFLPELDWSRLDAEMRRLQESEVRLKAENAELRKPDPTPWKIVLAGTVLGIAAGAYALRH